MASARGRTRVPFLFVLLGTLLFAATFASARDEEREQEQHEDRRRPYVFDRRSFRRTARSEHGSIRALPPFREASELLRGVRDYRVAVLEASPRSFVVPAHTDADTIGYVVQGSFVVAHL
jgi:hypothetical protein